MSDSLGSVIQAANGAILVEGDLDAIGEYFSPEYVGHGTERDINGPGAVRRFVGGIHSGFSDLEVTVEILVEAGDRVAWQRTIRGMHTGSFMGFPASGKAVVWRDMVTSRFAEGKIVEDWVITDLAERLMVARKGK